MIIKKLHYAVLLLVIIAVVVLFIIVQVNYFNGVDSADGKFFPRPTESDNFPWPVSVKHLQQIRLNETVTYRTLCTTSHHVYSVSVELNESIAKDMYKCSLKLGVSPGVLVAKRDKIRLIASRASHLLNAFWEVVPKNYLPRLKNPCWCSSNRTSQKLYCLPFFLLPGVPKSGTTTLHHVLSQHPQIVAPTGPIAGGKEPQWWHKIPLDMSRDGLKNHSVSYLKNFKTIADSIISSTESDGEGIVTYDASQTMLIDVEDYSFSIDNEDYCAMAAMISRAMPKEKIVIIMREPAARLYSHFQYFHGNVSWWTKEMKENISLYFHEHIQAAVQDFNKCLKQNSSIYECTNEVRTDRKALSLWLGQGIYYIYLLKWMQFWPRENSCF